MSTRWRNAMREFFSPRFRPRYLLYYPLPYLRERFALGKNLERLKYSCKAIVVCYQRVHAGETLLGFALRYFCLHIVPLRTVASPDWNLISGLAGALAVCSNRD